MGCLLARTSRQSGEGHDVTLTHSLKEVRANQNSNRVIKGDGQLYNNQLMGVMDDCLTDWLADWLAGEMDEWLYLWLASWLDGWLGEWMNG